MNFLRNRSFVSLGVYFLLLLAAVLIIEYLTIMGQLTRIEELHYHENFARQAEVSARSIVSLTDEVLGGNQEHSSQLLASLEAHDHALQIIGNGGRVYGTAIFLKKLSRLPQISFVELQKHWKRYQATAVRMTDESITNLPIQKNQVHAQWLSMEAWYDKLILDLDKDLADARNLFQWMLMSCVVIDLGLFVILFAFLYKRFILPLKEMERNTKQHEHTLSLANNELGHVAHEVNEVIEQLRDASEFVKRIGDGDLTLDYKELDARYVKGKNKLADSLVDMQGKLRDLNEEDRKRQWVNEGLAKFVDILRSSDENISELGDKIISTLTQYTKASQGSLYLLNDEEPGNTFLELVSLFAFDIKKFETRKIKLGEGLLGQTFLENQTTFIKTVPEEYIRITSGLGGDKPKSILIVPLKIDKNVYGVVELASFYVFKDYEIGFVERIGETIASTLATVKASQQTIRLLDESKSATEMMRSQEEEMRQNMEELQATQEEMGRKERDYIAKIDQLEKENHDVSEDEALMKAQNELVQLRTESERKLQELEVKLKNVPKGEDWRVADELEKTFRINLEAITIARDEQERKRM